MPKNNAFIVDELRTLLGLAQVDVACRKCERRGRISVARLIHDYGPEHDLPTLATKLAVGCPRLNSAGIYDRCGAWLPGTGEALNRAFYGNGKSPSGIR